MNMNEIDGYAIVDTYPDLEEVVIPDKYLGKRITDGLWCFSK